MDCGQQQQQQKQLHIVIFPWLAFGHLLPCLDLADRLASRGHRVSFVSTARNLSRLPPIHPSVELVALPFPCVDGLPDGAESTSDVVSLDMLELHETAADNLAAPFAEFLDAAAGKPDWVIVDSHPYWAVAAAAERNIPCVGLLLGPLGLLASQISPPGDAAAAEREEKPVATPDGGAKGSEMKKLSVWQRCAMTLGACQFVAVRSCAELEPQHLSVLLAPTATGKKTFLPLGLLPPSPHGRRGSQESSDSVRRWLDAQPAMSVVYVALGSQVSLREEQVQELALGLELAGTRFLWVLRNPAAFAGLVATLPPGFEDRTASRGLVATGWVSQLDVLAHPAVAAFLTHCGWGSTIEGLLYGHPLVMLPIADDQWWNAAMMEKKQVGVQVAGRGGHDGSFHREAIAAAVGAVLVTTADGAILYRANAKKLQQIVADRECHERYIDGFVHKLTSSSTYVPQHE